MVNMAAEITGMLGACNSSRLCPNSWQLPAVQGSRWAPGGCLKVWLLQSGVCPLSFPSLPLNFITGCPAVTQSKFGLVQRKINCLVELLWPFIKGRGVFRFFSLLCCMEMRSRKNEMKSGKIEVGWSPKGSTAVLVSDPWLSCILKQWWFLAILQLSGVFEFDVFPGGIIVHCLQH